MFKECCSDMLIAGAADFKGRLDQAVSRLMATRVDGDSARVAVPVLYPSGSGCAVDVVVNGDKCFVSDIALGHMEAEMQGANEFYDHCAKKAAERFGVGYDGLSVFASWASLDRIESAISAVANASVQAATAAIFRAMDEKEKQRNVELYERVSSIFGAHAVAKKAELVGRDASWEAHNVVTLPGSRKAVFEFVSESQNSIASKFMMFSDLSRLEGAVSLNSVVKSLDRIGKKGSMLADVSNVLPITAAADEFIKYADAP
jgi:hypothetical protein